MPVHIGIGQAEDKRLVAHECLVMALGIADGLLILTTIRKLVPDSTWAPLLVGVIRDELRPEVGDIHREAVVKAKASVLDRSSETRHTAHLFGDGDRIGVDAMDQLIGQREVRHSIGILMTIEVVGVRGEALAEAVVVVQHRGDAVEAEAVELEDLQPILTVGEEEVHDVVASVVEAQRVPSGMIAARPFVEEERAGAVIACQPFDLIAYGMTVHEVHDDLETSCVSSIDERLQFVGRTEAATGCEEAGDMVAKGAIVRMLLDGHDLNGIIPEVNDTGKDLLLELTIATYLALL